MFRFDVRHFAAALAVLLVASCLIAPGVAFAGGQSGPLGGWVKQGLSGQSYVWQAGSC